MLRTTQCRCQSNGPYWLSISQPSCPRLWRWRKAVLGSRHSMFSFREAPLLFRSHYPRAPCLRKAPLQQHASAPGQRSGIIEVVFIYLSIFNTCCLCDCEKCSSEGRVEVGFSWGGSGEMLQEKPSGDHAFWI